MSALLSLLALVLMQGNKKYATMALPVEKPLLGEAHQRGVMRRYWKNMIVTKDAPSIYARVRLLGTVQAERRVDGTWTNVALEDWGDSYTSTTLLVSPKQISYKADGKLIAFVLTSNGRYLPVGLESRSNRN